MFKINISNKDGKTYKLELESEDFLGMELGQKIPGNLLLADLRDYELEITGLSDKAGFTSMIGIPGTSLKKQLLGYGKAMHKRSKGVKKKIKKRPKGLRLRKTVRGRAISPEINQINIKVLKEGTKKLSEIFQDQNKEKPAKESRKTKRQKANKDEKQQEGVKKTEEKQEEVKTENKQENTE